MHRVATRGRWPTEPLDLSVLKSFDADINFKAPAVIYGKFLLEKTDFSVVVADGVLTTRRLNGVIFGGVLAASARAEAAAQNQFRTKIKLTGVDVAEEQLRSARATLAELERIRARLTLKANAYGTVGLYLKPPGDTVSVGDEIVERYDRERQHIVLPVPSRLITRYPIGTLVTLRFSGPVKCRGRVAKVPPHTEQNIMTPPGEDPLVRLVIEPVGRLWPVVPIGSSVEAEVE